MLTVCLESMCFDVCYYLLHNKNSGWRNRVCFSFFNHPDITPNSQRQIGLESLKSFSYILSGKTKNSHLEGNSNVFL